MPTDNDRPVTRRELDEVLTGRLTAMEDRLVEKMRDMQTEVLRAFRDCDRPA